MNINKKLLVVAIASTLTACAGQSTSSSSEPAAANDMAPAKSSMASKHVTMSGPAPLAPLASRKMGYAPDNKYSKAKSELGKMLFFDPRLGGDASVSCASCHDPEQGWAWAEDFSRGYPGTVHWRNSQTIINSQYLGKQFWAGGAASGEKQAKSAATGAVAGNGESDIMEARLALIPEYRKRFNDVFGDEWPLIGNAWRAIAVFEKELVQTDTPLDKYLEGDKAALSAEQVRGKALFEGKAGCIQCHNGALTSDEKYYNIGVPTAPRWEEDGLAQITFRYELYAKGMTQKDYRTTKDDPGFYFRTKNAWDKGKFRTPSLRYTMYTAPYMHNGAFYSLEEVVDFYNRGGFNEDGKTTSFPKNKTSMIKPLGLSDNEKADLLAFIEAFSGDEIAIDKPDLPKYARLFSEKELKEAKK
ncbi:MAG: cytochrome-c peroxidase [Gammaproteobacteria bacterium]|nr:cytochrome-c peroxidase [Gammaproteobacteria bacterium]